MPVDITSQYWFRVARSFFLLLKNKAALIALFLIYSKHYQGLTAAYEARVREAVAAGLDATAVAPVAFAELRYGVIILLWGLVITPFARLAFFPEIAVYAESGGLREDLGGRVFTPALIHYWWSSTICFAVSCLPLMVMQGL